MEKFQGLYGKGHPYNDFPFKVILDKVILDALYYPPQQRINPNYRYGWCLLVALNHLDILKKNGLSQNEKNLRRLFGHIDKNGFVNNIDRQKVIEKIRKEELIMSNTDNNAIKLFSFNDNQVRVLMKDDEPWFVARDVCDVLYITWSGHSLDYISEKNKAMVKLTTPRGEQDTTCISESGLYKLIMRSNKPEAERFQDWVTDEVIPSIRKHGAYMTPQKLEEVLLNPDTIIKLAQNLKAEQEKNRYLQETINQNRPKVLFADSVSASETSILIGNLAKILKQNGVNIGQKRLFAWLRDNGYLMKMRGENYNMPTQRAMELDLFEIKERSIINPDDTVRITKTTKVTGKGQLYFVNKFLGKEVAA